MTPEESTKMAEKFKGTNPETQVKLQEDISAALLVFQNSNKEVPPAYLMRSAMDVFLLFPWSWFNNFGSQDEFVERMKLTINEFYLMVKGDQDASNVSK